jgi:hypothetical protein
MREQHPHALANQPQQNNPLAGYGFRVRSFDAQAGRAETGPGIGNEETYDEGEIDDPGESPQCREELVAFANGYSLSRSVLNK